MPSIVALTRATFRAGLPLKSIPSATWRDGRRIKAAREIGRKSVMLPMTCVFSSVLLKNVQDKEHPPLWSMSSVFLDFSKFEKRERVHLAAKVALMLGMKVSFQGR